MVRKLFQCSILSTPNTDQFHGEKIVSMQHAFFTKHRSASWWENCFNVAYFLHQTQISFMVRKLFQCSMLSSPNTDQFHGEKIVSMQHAFFTKHRSVSWWENCFNAACFLHQAQISFMVRKLFQCSILSTPNTDQFHGEKIVSMQHTFYTKHRSVSWWENCFNAACFLHQTQISFMVRKLFQCSMLSSPNTDQFHGEKIVSM